MGVISVDALVSSTAAAADRRVRAAPDGGKFTAFPPVVCRAAVAVPTAQDVRVDAEHWGGSGGGGCRSWREPERRAEDGGPDLSMVFVIYGWLLLPLSPLLSLLSSAKDSQKMELVHAYKAFYTSEFQTLRHLLIPIKFLALS